VDVDFGVFNFDINSLSQVLVDLFTRNHAFKANESLSNGNRIDHSSNNHALNRIDAVIMSSKRVLQVFKNISIKSIRCTPVLPLMKQMISLNCTELSLSHIGMISTYWNALSCLTIGYQSKIVDQWVGYILEMKSLKQLSIESCERLSHNGLINLFSHPTIVKMRLNRVTFSSLEIFNRLKSSNRVLQTLELSHRNGDLWLDDATFIILSQHASIRHLMLSNFLIREAYTWLASPDCKLRTLSLANCEIQNHPQFIAQLCSNTSISDLNFAIQPEMQYETLSSVLNMKNLKRLEVDSGIWFHEIDAYQMLQFRKSLKMRDIAFIEWP
jgi:hypothetical protein